MLTTLPQRINSFITSNQELRQISGKVRQLHALQLQYEKVAPPSLLRSSRVIQFEQNILTLAANNSAVAAKLRQMSPELARKLQGCEVTGILVRVQVSLPAVAHTAKTAALSVQGKKQLTDLADTLADSPLKSALQRLADTQKGRQ